MAGKLNVYNLGSNGVNVDANPVELEDGELTKAQNAVHDILGSAGGIRKRAGLVKVNGSAAAGAIRGALAVPLSAGGQAVGPGGTAPASARTIYVGKAVASTGASSGWYASTDLFATAPPVASGIANTVGRAKRTNLAAPATGRWQQMSPAGVSYNNRLYYAGDNYTLGTTAPEIRVWDGVTDRQLCTVPGFINKSSNSVQTYAIQQMCVATDGYIYLTTYGTGVGVATYEGHVWRLNPETGALVMIGARFTDCFPEAIIWFANRLWTGTYTGASGTTLAKIYSYRPGIDTAWQLAFTTAASPGIRNFASYKGKLYATLDGGSAGAAPLVVVRSSLGVWSTSFTGTAGALTTNLGAIVFKNNLYVSYYSDLSVSSLLKKYDGTSWTTVYTAAGSLLFPYYFFQDNGTLFAVGAYGSVRIMLTTTDGSSWTDRSSSFSGNIELLPLMGVIIT